MKRNAGQSADSEPYRFRNFGRSYHFVVETAADLEKVLHLEPSHWMALSAPVGGIFVDRALLTALDRDSSDRITYADVQAAISWVLGVFRDRSGLETGSTVLSLDAVEPSSADGNSILTAARKVLHRGGRSSNRSISLEEVRKAKAVVESRPVSEAGVVLPSAAGSDEMAAFIGACIEVTGGCDHPGGGKGLDNELYRRFQEQARAYLSWKEKGMVPSGAEVSPLAPLGSATEQILGKHRDTISKVDQFFALCSAAVIDKRVLEEGFFDQERLSALRGEEASRLADEVRAAPLAQPTTSMRLLWNECTNHYFVGVLADFRASVLEPFIGSLPEGLTVSQWELVREKLSPHEQWMRERPEKADLFSKISNLEDCLGSAQTAAVESLIEHSRATAIDLDNIRLAERRVRDGAPGH